jgi:hypothetical protein
VTLQHSKELGSLTAACKARIVEIRKLAEQVGGAVTYAIASCVDAKNAKFRANVGNISKERVNAEVPRSSESLLGALVEGDFSVRKSRRLLRQLNDGLPLLAAVSERHQEKAFIAFLRNLDLGRCLRHGDRTQCTKASSYVPQRDCPPDYQRV